MRNDVLASDLAKAPMNRWMLAYLEAMKTAGQELGQQEGAQVGAVLDLKLNQAEQENIKAIFEKNERKTGWGRRWRVGSTRAASHSNERHW